MMQDDFITLGEAQPSSWHANATAPGARSLALRPYQEECLAAVAERGTGRWLVQMATGLGKTVVFSRIQRRGRMLILSHREELVRQPVKYFRVPVGIEMAGHKSSARHDVVSASVQTLAGRLARFAPEEFDTVVVDEAHHAAASTYKKILEYFRPRVLLGFTATPNRGDGVRLDDVFDAIVFQRDLRWGIEQGWLAPIECLRVNIGYDLSGIKSRMGDYAAGELEKAVNIEGANRAVADSYLEHAIGPTLVFGVTVEHCKALARLIPGAVVVDAGTKNRAEIFRDFTAGRIPCLVNCMIATEGTDLPTVRTVMMVRPTQSVALYTQMVGRGTRLAEGKDKCRLIDCVGNSRHDLCTAPSLIGLDASQVPAKYQMDIMGDLLVDLPELIESRMDTPETWIRNVKVVDLFAKKNGLDMRGINFFRHASGELAVYLGGRRWIKITAPDLRGQAVVYTSKGKAWPGAPVQDCINTVHGLLATYAKDQSPLWSLNSFKRWGSAPASDKQKALCERFLKGSGVDAATLTKGEASMILNRRLGG
jgi:hypothetical protein